MHAIVIRSGTIVDGTGAPRYEATICAGEVTFVGGEPTGARPGRLVRAARQEAAA